MKEAAKRGIISYMMALGLTLALLGCLDMLHCGWMAAAVLAGITLALTAASVKKLTRWLSIAAVAMGAAGWLLLGGMDTVKEILRAVTLHFTGLNGALPMVAQETALILSVLLGVACFALTRQGMGGYPALTVTILAALVLWLGDQPQALPWLAPAIAGGIAQAALSNHEGLSLGRIFPLAAVITGLALLLTPMTGVTVQPMKDAADKLRDQIFARFMFTQPRNVFSLASEGFYPQGQGQLGGKAEPTDHPVMLVKTPRKVYLRGSVKNEYTGRMWVDTLAGRRYLWSSLRWQDSRSDTFNMALPQGALGEDSGLMAYQTVSIRMLDSSASSLFVPQRIRSLNPGGELVPYFNLGSEVFVTRDLQQDDTYTVTAPLMMAGDAGLGTLIQACESTADPLYPQIMHDYTALPDHLQEQVFQLAQEACEGAETAYDKAYAIQTYLSRNFRYTLDVAPQPENIDFVSNFLLKTKEGYCTYFASAMTVLCRMAGLPARYVEGYIAEPDEEGHAYVTGLHGHAWTEVYFEGFGWLTFDATPAQNLQTEVPEDMLPPEAEEPDTTPEPEDEPPADEPTPTPQPEDASQPPMEDSPTPPPADNPNQEPEQKEPPLFDWLWWLLPLLLIAAAAVRIILTQPKHCASHAKDELGRWSAWLQAVNDQLRILHLGRESNESPLAFARRIDGLKRFPVSLTPLGEVMSLVFYGRLAPEPEETAMAAQAYEKILSRMTGWQKVKLTLLRAFTPVKKRLFTK
ncbi:MAG: hypothetical protein J6K13_07825 [Clostridia bacterium]|nr:hypothetical protein [Clostridia bacterium]